MQQLGRRPQAVALGSLVAGIVLVVAKLFAGLATGSLGLVSEAVHSSLDVVASAFALVAVRAARKPADDEHPYGHGRAENLAAFTEGLLLLLTAAGIGYEAVLRLLGSHAEVNAAWYAIALMAIAIVVEAGRGAVLRRVGQLAGSQALEADALNRGADVLSSAGVLAGLIAARAGYPLADAIAALLVAVLVARAAVQITWRAGDILLDRAPSGTESELRRAISRVAGVRAVRAVRVRRSGPHLIGDARIVTRRMLSIEAAQNLSDEVRGAVAAALPNVELSVIIEGDPQASDLVERVHAAAARQGKVQDLHNVTVEQEDDGSLHLSMHAKLPGELSLENAASTSSDLERDLREELPDVSRIDVHLEPLEPGLVRGEDVTRARRDVAVMIRKIVEAQPEVLRCRDVELSSRGGGITAHVVAVLPGSVSLEEAHTVETDLERKIREALPELHEVVARVEPGQP
jgi:cation diffusion facilitator family transporter